METVLLHLERLRRHHDAVEQTYDQVSFLDLSHTLRIWTELKAPLAEISPRFSKAKSFKTSTPARKAIKAVRGYEFAFASMPGGVSSRAGKKWFFANPDRPISESNFLTLPGGSGREHQSGLRLKIDSDRIILHKFHYVLNCSDQKVGKALTHGSISTTRCTFANWLGAEAVRLAYLDEEGLLRNFTISREMIIKRVANTMDGSHSSTGDQSDYNNRFDPLVRVLSEYQLMGVSLPYYILLKVAQDILEVAPRLLGVDQNGGQS